MDPVHARYPFLTSARERVREADVGLGEMVTGEERHPAVERGMERVRRALVSGTVRPDPDDGRRWENRTEVLSYPVARVLVSLLDTPGAVEKYASAEADTAYERFTDDFENPDDGLKSTPDDAISLDALLAEFDLRGAVEETRDGNYRIAVERYLSLAANLDGDSWRLPTRELADGAVKIGESELHELLREAVREQVAEGLPTENVPEQIRAGLADEVAELDEAFSELDVSQDIDVLDPDAFPPCVTGLLDRARSGDSLDAPAEFALVAFLTSANADTDEIYDLAGIDGDTRKRAVNYRVARVGDDSGAQYAPPSCETMADYDACPVADGTVEDVRCETIAHPLTYYEDALADAGDGDS